KGRLAERIVEDLAEYHDRRAALAADPGRVEDILRAGADKARKVAQSTMTEVRAKLGLWR
ncbi:MAG: tryptophan--tRNA ligase, partial [Rhodoglobus sp.]